MNTFLLLAVLLVPAQQIIAPPLIPAHTEHEKEAVEVSRGSAVHITPIQKLGHGTGTYVKIDKSFFVITAKHVTRGHDKFFVNTNAGSSIGEKIYEFKNKDISVLRVAKIKDVKPIIFDAGCALKIGETVYFSGFPSHYSLMTTRAFISGANGKTVKYLQGMAWFGSSGSGIINNKGKLCAVVVAIATEKRGFFVHALESLNYIHTITMDDILVIRKAIEEKKSQ